MVLVMFIVFYIYLYLRIRKEERSGLLLGLYVLTFYGVNRWLQYNDFYEFYLSGVVFNFVINEVFCFLEFIHTNRIYHKRLNNVLFNLSKVELKVSGAVRFNFTDGLAFNGARVAHRSEELQLINIENKIELSTLFFMHLSWIMPFIFITYIYKCFVLRKKSESLQIIQNWRELEENRNLSESEVIRILRFSLDDQSPIVYNISFSDKAEDLVRNGRC